MSSQSIKMRIQFENNEETIIEDKIFKKMETLNNFFEDFQENNEDMLTYIAPENIKKENFDILVDYEKKYNSDFSDFFEENIGLFVVDENFFSSEAEEKLKNEFGKLMTVMMTANFFIYEELVKLFTEECSVVMNRMLDEVHDTEDHKVDENSPQNRQIRVIFGMNGDPDFSEKESEELEKYRWVYEKK